MGTAQFCQYSFITKEWSDEEDRLDMFLKVHWDFLYLLSDIEVLADDEDITKQKGKYFIDKNMLQNMLYNSMIDESDQNNIDFWLVDQIYYRGHVELDVEDFNPAKLQLIKSTHEFDEIPYAIDAYCIIYDGKRYNLTIDYFNWGPVNVNELTKFVIEM